MKNETDNQQDKKQRNIILSQRMIVRHMTRQQQRMMTSAYNNSVGLIWEQSEKHPKNIENGQGWTRVEKYCGQTVIYPHQDKYCGQTVIHPHQQDNA